MDSPTTDYVVVNQSRSNDSLSTTRHTCVPIDWSWNRSWRQNRRRLPLFLMASIFTLAFYFLDFVPGDLNLHAGRIDAIENAVPLRLNSSKIAIVTARYGSIRNPVFERSCKLQQSYAIQHGYDFWLARSELVPGIWTKAADLLELILNEMEKPKESQLKWIFWLDSDALIVNYLIPLYTFLPPADFDHINFVGIKDWNGLNAGVFFIKVCSWSVEFLGAVLGYQAVNPGKFLPYLEQTAMQTLLEENEYFRNNAVLGFSQRWFNAYYWIFQPGDFLLHFAGLLREDRETRLSSMMDKVDKHLIEYEIPITNLSLPKELSLFWEERRGKEKGT